MQSYRHDQRASDRKPSQTSASYRALEPWLMHMLIPNQWLVGTYICPTPAGIVPRPPRTASIMSPPPFLHFVHLNYFSLLGIFGAAAIYAFFRFLRSTSSTLPSPPGPKPLPLLGNLLDVPPARQWLVYSQWAERYGI